MKENRDSFCENSRKEKHNFLDQFLNHCYFDDLTRDFYCKKRNCVINVDWHRKYAFCTVHGNFLSM